MYPLTVAQLIAHQQLQVLRRAIQTQNWQQPPPYSSQAAASLKCVQKRENIGELDFYVRVFIMPGWNVNCGH